MLTTNTEKAQRILEERETAIITMRAWMEVFPHGHATRKEIMGSQMVSLYLQNPNKWTNGIAQNDPLSYAIRVQETETIKEWRLHCLTRPPKGKNLVYETIGKRKRTIKKVTYPKLIKRFQDIKEWIETLDLKHEI